MSQILINQDTIGKFMVGTDRMERIVNITYDYQNPYVTIFYRDKYDRKCSKKELLLNLTLFYFLTKYLQF